MTEFPRPASTWLGRLVWWLFVRPALLLNLDLWFMSSAKLREHLVTKLVAPICYHRDQRGDDRCWYDDLMLYWHLPESIRYPVKLSREQMAARCAYYRRCRGSDKRPARLPEQCAEQPHAYLQGMSRRELMSEAHKLRAGIRKHQRIGTDKLAVEDDEKLYALLPGGIEADFRLPPTELFLPNCALICGMTDPNDVDLSSWPGNRTSPLAGWRPEEN